METLKKPETIISLINTTALLGVSVYFYRRINGIEQELVKHTEHLTSTIKKVKEMQVVGGHVKQLAGAIRDLNGIMGAQKNEISLIRNFVDYQQNQIDELQGHAKESGAELKLTQHPLSQMQNQGFNQGFNQGHRPNQGYGNMGQNQVQFSSSSRYNNQMNQGPNQMSQGYNNQMNQMNQGYNNQVPQGYNNQMNQMSQGPSQMSQGYNNQMNQMPQGYNNQMNQMNQGYNNQMQGGMGPNHPPQQPKNSLLDMGLDFGNNMNQEPDDLDDQIDAVRRARQNSPGMQMGELGI